LNNPRESKHPACAELFMRRAPRIHSIPPGKKFPGASPREAGPRPMSEENSLRPTPRRQFFVRAGRGGAAAGVDN